jgi:hypothetical protein
MPKLPANYVQAPSFDNPLRATSSKHAIVERKVVFHMDELTWNALQAASEREDASAEVLIQRALDRWLAEPAPAAMAPRGDAPKQSLREQLIEKLHERFAQRGWVQRLLTLREVLREGRA